MHMRRGHMPNLAGNRRGSLGGIVVISWAGAQLILEFGDAPHPCGNSTQAWGSE